MPKETDFIFGLRPVIEAIRSGKQIDRLLIKDGLKGSLYHELMSIVRENDVYYQFVPGERLEILTRKNHQGVIAWLSAIEYQHIGNILPTLFERGRDPFIVILDNITDVRNFGAIVRTAECMGVDSIIIPEKGSARISADAVKTSAGALHNLPVCREKNLIRTTIYLKESGLRIICADEKSGNNVMESDLSGPSALIMGSEEKGIRKELLYLADVTVRIPMTGNIGSLNVSVATGILLYEIIRQRSS
jgi:23S rRNA (guanosine2251-2'-O)-methyltransferase